MFELSFLKVDEVNNQTTDFPNLARSAKFDSRSCSIAAWLIRYGLKHVAEFPDIPTQWQSVRKLIKAGCQFPNDDNFLQPLD